MVKIKSAAIKYFNLDLNIWQIVTGKNYIRCFSKLYQNNIRFDENNYEEGFVTNQGNEHFVSPTHAGYIAWRAGQIKEIPNHFDKLWHLFYI